MSHPLENKAVRRGSGELALWAEGTVGLGNGKARYRKGQFRTSIVN
jgi:hypothetical protein